MNRKETREPPQKSYVDKCQGEHMEIFETNGSHGPCDNSGNLDKGQRFYAEDTPDAQGEESYSERGPVRCA